LPCALEHSAHSDERQERFWLLLTGAATIVVCAAALALLAGVNFQGC
jgi:hypothetical protein